MQEYENLGCKYLIALVLNARSFPPFNVIKQWQGFTGVYLTKNQTKQPPHLSQRLDVLAHTFNSNTWEAEGKGQPGLQSETLSQ